MNKLVITIIVLMISISLKSQVTLRIVIKDLENSKGRIVLDFRDGNDNSIADYSEKIVDNQCVILVKDLKLGKYSFKYFHDENNNIELDTNVLGIPKEGYGFSNDAKGKFGPPDFDDTVFELKDNAMVVCRPNYIY